MSASDGPNGTAAPSPAPNYEWRYEYYDEEEPVSFEGLEAHRYSIVIGFWVGLAVFVVFMFFLLTLLTKTGAPHPDSSQPCEKRPQLTGYMDTNFNSAAPPPQPGGPDSSCSLFQFYMSKEGQVSPRALWASAGGGGGGVGASGGCYRRPSSGSSLGVGDGALQQELALLDHFSIPNCVSSEQSSTVGEDDLLLGEPELPIILEGRDHNDDGDLT